ncbi:MAG: glycoside hydrolase family 99-like domain-containing protein [Acidobacteriota bacterium]
MRKTVLICSYHVPQLDRDSGARRVFHTIEFLQQDGWAVTFLASDGIGCVRDARALRQRSVAVYDGREHSLEELLQEGHFDLAIIAFWSNAERYLPAIRQLSPNTRVIVDSIDLHFLREARACFHQKTANLENRLLDGQYGLRLTRELNTYASADAVLTVSQKEADLINDFVSDGELAHRVPDYEDLQPGRIPFSKRKGILSVGSFQHAPNVEAVQYLCEEIVPRLEKRLLQEHPVYIVGNCLDETSLVSRHQSCNVRMVGWVPSVEPYYEQTRISVIPLLYGAGTKRKMIHALMAGIPTVTTSVGAEGLNLVDGEHVLIADDPESFATAITRLLSDSKLWTRLANQGYELIVKAHSREVARHCLMGVIQSAFDRRVKTYAPPDAAKQTYVSDESYQELIRNVRGIVREEVPADAKVVVISKGDQSLLDLDGREAWHFPQREDGAYAGHYPAHSADAIAHLESLRQKGANFLVLPRTANWWLEHYADFRHHLESHYRRVESAENACVLYELENSANGNGHSTGAAVEPVRGGQSLDLCDSNGHGGDTKLIAFYLPQFHPIPENDEWWGEGFTEWRNVARAEPLFAGHYQPHVPADLGFYDLRLPETQHRQAELARSYGIYGFCYYHYWFNGKRLLERPFNQVLKSGQPDYPFSLCWANDPWSRRWDGRTNDLLQDQTYSAEDDIAHIRWLLPALADPRAIKIEGKPIFLIYRGKHLPDPASTIDIWRREVHRAGLGEIYLIAVESAWDLGWDATQVGFDAKLLFQPQFGKLMTAVPRIKIPGKDELQVYDYRDAWSVLGNLEPVSYRRYETVFPGWDNTPRVGDKAVVIHDATPAAFQEQLHRAIARLQTEPKDQRIVFINAWNEWAEGCHLEPDSRHGHAFLEATKAALWQAIKLESAQRVAHGGI